MLFKCLHHQKPREAQRGPFNLARGRPTPAWGPRASPSSSAQPRSAAGAPAPGTGAPKHLTANQLAGRGGRARDVLAEPLETISRVKTWADLGVMPAGGNFHFKAFPDQFVGPVAYIRQQLRIQRQIRWNWRWQVSVQVLLLGWLSETSSGENPNERTETQNVSSSEISQELRGHLKSAQDVLGSAHAEDGYHQQMQLFRRHVSPENSWVWYMRFKKIIFR